MCNKCLKTPIAQPEKQVGVTLMEMVVTIVLFSVMASLGALLISKLSPSYMTTTQTEQMFSAREAALWRLSEDFRVALIDSPGVSGCVLSLNLVSAANGTLGDDVLGQIVSYAYSGNQIRRNNVLLLENVLLESVAPFDTCPFYFVSGTDRTRLTVAFRHTTNHVDEIITPISTTYYSFVNGPYAASAVLSVAPTSTVTINGYFPGLTGGILSSVSFSPIVSYTLMPATINQISATVTPIASATIDVTVSTVEGFSILKGAFQFP